jgi:hypothetical protein
MKGYYLRMNGCYFGKMFKTYQEAVNFAEGMNKVGHVTSYTIEEI